MKGPQFEQAVETQLTRLLEAGGLTEIERTPRLALSNGQVRIPDFVVALDLGPAHLQIAIECQDRARSTRSDLIEKILYIRDHSPIKCFVIVVAAAVTNSLELECTRLGIPIQRYAEFRSSIDRYLEGARSNPLGVHSGQADDAKREDQASRSTSCAAMVFGLRDRTA